MKKRNIFLISVIVLIIIFLVFLYIFRLKFSKETNLLCTFKGYNTTLKTNIDTSVLSTFKGNKLDKINITVDYSFDNIDNYNKWKTLYENNISIFGTTIEKSLANINYNEQSKTISVIINDNGSFANKIKGITNKYPSIKDYFVNLGYNCKNIKSSINKNLVSVSSIINGKNNVFEYSNYEFIKNEVDNSYSLSFGTIKNITNANKSASLNITFYDNLKNEIGKYNANYDIVISPNKSSELSFKLDNIYLYSGHKYEEVKYVSFNNI